MTIPWVPLVSRTRKKFSPPPSYPLDPALTHINQLVPLILFGVSKIVLTRLRLLNLEHKGKTSAFKRTKLLK